MRVAPICAVLSVAREDCRRLVAGRSASAALSAIWLAWFGRGVRGFRGVGTHPDRYGAPFRCERMVGSWRRCVAVGGEGVAGD